MVRLLISKYIQYVKKLINDINIKKIYKIFVQNYLF